MPVYCVHLKNDTAWAATEIEADDLDAAFAKAVEIDSSQLTFEFFSEPLPIVEIAITDPDGAAWTWQADDLLLRLAAEGLLIAAKNVLTALQDELLAPGADPATRVTLRHLKDAIDCAEGRKA